MLNVIRELFSPASAPAPEKATERLRVATCALLLEVAGADDDFAPEECSRIIQALRERFDLPQEEAEELIRVADERKRDTVDLWRFTSIINEQCSREEKEAIIEEIWRVIFADGHLEAHEDYLVHKLARLLNLSHPQLITAKSRARAPRA